jgi:hypothetical protein
MIHLQVRLNPLYIYWIFLIRGIDINGKITYIINVIRNKNEKLLKKI